jgi:hypothetical protein
MALVPFRPEHLAAIRPPALDPDELPRFSRDYRRVGPAWTLIEGGEVLGCGGVVVSDGISRAWVILSQPVRAMPVHRAARRALRLVESDIAVHRIEARALAQFVAAQKWLARLGFRAAGRDGDYEVYVR